MKNSSRFVVLRSAKVSSLKNLLRVALFLPVFLVVGMCLVGTAWATAPTLTLSATSGPPTTKIQVSGAAFPASVAVDIAY